MPISYASTLNNMQLSQAMYKYMPDEKVFIANKIAPPIGVKDKKGMFPVIPADVTLANTDEGKRAPGANFDRYDTDFTYLEYECEEYGFEHKIPVEQELEFGNYINCVELGLMTLKEKLWIGRERRMSTLLFNTSTWTGASLYTDVSGSEPFDTAGSDVIGAISSAIDKVRDNTGRPANTMIINYAQFKNLVTKNTAIKALLAGLKVATPQIVAEWLAPILGLEKIIVGGGVYNSGNEADANPTISNVWSSTYALICITPNTANIAEPSVARLLYWQPYGSGTDAKVKAYFENQCNSDILQASFHEDEIVVDAKFGHLLKID